MRSFFKVVAILMMVGGLSVLLIFQNFQSWNAIVGMTVMALGFVGLMYASVKTRAAN